jgi:hypothetical protein
MGTRGPVPKRSNQRMGHRTKAELAGTDVVKISAPVVDQPPGDPEWHPIALHWYESLAESGQGIYYEPSDWAAAHYVASVMTRHLTAPRLNSQLFGGIWAAMNDLMTTEGSRRRLRLELERDTGASDEQQRASIIADYRMHIA